MIESKHAHRTNQTIYEHFNAKRGRQGPSERQWTLCFFCSRPVGSSTGRLKMTLTSHLSHLLIPAGRQPIPELTTTIMQQINQHKNRSRMTRQTKYRTWPVERQRPQIYGPNKHGPWSAHGFMPDQHPAQWCHFATSLVLKALQVRIQQGRVDKTGRPGALTQLIFRPPQTSGKYVWSVLQSKTNGGELGLFRLSTQKWITFKGCRILDVKLAIDSIDAVKLLVCFGASSWGAPAGSSRWSHFCKLRCVVLHLLRISCDTCTK